LLEAEKIKMKLKEYHNELKDDIKTDKVKLCEHCKGIVGDWYCDVDILKDKPHWHDIPCFEDRFNSCPCK
jgi:hypothetical protein